MQVEMGKVKVRLRRRPKYVARPACGIHTLCSLATKPTSALYNRYGTRRQIWIPKISDVYHLYLSSHVYEVHCY